jgi:hypothetical protein
MSDPVDSTPELDAEFDKVFASFAQFAEDFPDQDVDQAVRTIDAAVMRIVAEAPLDTLRDVQLYSRALLTRYENLAYDSETLNRLLKALEPLPERLWDVRIA